MKLKNALTAWNPQSAEVKVGPLLDRENWFDWTKPYLMTGGAAEVYVRELEGIEAGHFIMSEFIGLVVRDGVDLQAAYREFMKIEEFRKAVPPDLEWDWDNQNKNPRRD